MRDHLPIPDVPTTLEVGPTIQAAGTHTAALGALVASFVGWVPVIVALIPAVYYLILIWESSTVQHFVRNLRMRRQARKLLRLQAKAKIAQAKLDAEEMVRAARSQAKETIKVAAAEAAKAAITDSVKLETKVPPV